MTTISPKPEHQIGRDLADVIATHTDLQAHTITEIHATSDEITVSYAIRLGPGPSDFEIRTRTYDPRTGNRTREHTDAVGVF